MGSCSGGCNDNVVGYECANCKAGEKATIEVECVEGATNTTTTTTNPPVDCQWSNWSILQECSRTCGGGTKTSIRAEQVRAKHGGKSCIGSRTKLEKCNVQSCPDEILQARAATIATTTTTASTTSRTTATTTTTAATTGSEKGRNLASGS